MTEKTFQLEITTPQKLVFDGDIVSLVAESIDGLFGILVNHAPMVSALRYGTLKIKTQEQKEKLFCLSDGVLEIDRNKCIILVDTAECKTEIDLERAKRARERAIERLRARQQDIDIDRAKAALHRALIRLKIVEVTT